jgi:Fe-S cluster assembly protein SufD
LPYAGATALRLVVVNGRFAPELSRLAALPRGLRAGSLAAAVNGDLQADSEMVQRYLGQLADFSSRAFAALNTAFIEDGAYVHVPDGIVLEEPLQIIFVSAPGDPVVSHPRTLIVLGERSQARIVETYVGASDVQYFANAVTEVFVGESAVLDHYKVQQESDSAFHVGSMHVNAARSANFSSHSFSLGGKLVRNDALATLDGEGAEVTLNGLYLADGDRLVDNHTTIDHARAHCPSHEVYKGILGGRARAVFNGKIIVRQDAQKTDAKQTNRALLLTDDALINTKPQLEIFADDVKCTHGAAIGQLDDDAIFYLRARGLTFFEARDMLIHAFAGQILERVKVEPLRTALESELYARLARDLAEVDGK